MRPSESSSSYPDRRYYHELPCGGLAMKIMGPVIAKQVPAKDNVRLNYFQLFFQKLQDL